MINKVGWTMHTYQAMCWKGLMPSGSQRGFCWGRGFVPRGKVDHLMECNSITSMFDPIYRTGMSAVAWTPLSWCSVSSWGGMAGLWMLAQITQDWVDWLHTSSSMLPQYKSTWDRLCGTGFEVRYVCGGAYKGEDCIVTSLRKHSHTNWILIGNPLNIDSNQNVS